MHKSTQPNVNSHNHTSAHKHISASTLSENNCKFARILHTIIAVAVAVRVTTATAADISHSLDATPENLSWVEALLKC